MVMMLNASSLSSGVQTLLEYLHNLLAVSSLSLRKTNLDARQLCASGIMRSQTTTTLMFSSTFHVDSGNVDDIALAFVARIE